MHLAIDVREACSPARTGKGQWTYGFVTELLSRDLTLTLCTDVPLPRAWRDAFHAGKPAPRIIERRKTGLRWHLDIARFLKTETTIDAYVSPTSYIIPALVGHRMPCVPVVHDLIAFGKEPHDRKAQLIERLTLSRTVQFAQRVCTISTQTRDDLLERFPHIDGAKVIPIFAGPSKPHTEPNVPDHRTILCTGTLCPRKNQRRLIEAYASLPAALRSSFRLVLAGGRGWGDDDIVRLARDTAGVEWLGYASDRTLEQLLSSSTVFALPSLYEGFGLPVLDALQRGIPVLTSGRGSLKEVAGDAAVIADPDDADSIAKALQSLLTNTILREQLRQKGPPQAARYSWKRTAGLFLSSLP